MHGFKVVDIRYQSFDLQLEVCAPVEYVISKRDVELTLSMLDVED